MDSLCVNVETRIADADASAREGMGRELAHHIKSTIGVSAKVAVKTEGEVERSVGKAKRVIDRRKDG